MDLEITIGVNDIHKSDKFYFFSFPLSLKNAEATSIKIIGRKALLKIKKRTLCLSAKG